MGEKTVSLSEGRNFLWKFWYGVTYFFKSEWQKPTYVSVCWFFWRGVFMLVPVTIVLAISAVLFLPAWLFGTYPSLTKDSQPFFTPYRGWWKVGGVRILPGVIALTLGWMYLALYPTISGIGWTHIWGFISQARSHGDASWQLLGFILVWVTSSLLFLLIVGVMLVVGLSDLKARRRERKYRDEGPRSPLVEYLKAKKAKMCFIIHFIK